MKKLIVMTTAMLILLFSISAVAAYDSISSFRVDKNEVTINPGSSYRVNFLFQPEGKIGEVYLDPDPSSAPDTSIADISLYDDHVVITGKKTGTTVFSLVGAYHNEFQNQHWERITVKVVDTKVSLSSSLNSINEMYNEDLSYILNIGVSPAEAINMLGFYSDDPSIASISQSNQDKPRFFIDILRPGTTALHFMAGNTEITIPVIIREASAANMSEAVLPDLITKETVKAAYEKYLKPYNTAFQYDKIFNENIDGVTSEAASLTSANIKKAENQHNFFRVITGTRPVTYLDTLNKKALVGSNFCNKVQDIDHSQADGIDSQASEVLHSSNLSRCYSLTSAVSGMIWEDGNRGGFYSVGHRSWMLDNRLSNWGLAKTNFYWDQYFDRSTLDQSKSKVVAFPSRGAFPIEAINNYQTAWSIDLGEPYCPNLSNVRVFVTDQNGTKIELSHYRDNPKDPNGCFEYGGGYGDGNGIVFYPKKFIEIDAGKDLSKLVGKSYTVRIEGLTLKAPGSVSYVPCKPLEYTVNFISIAQEGWNPQITSAKIINSRTGQELSSTVDMKVGETIELELKVTPQSLQSASHLSGSINPFDEYMPLDHWEGDNEKLVLRAHKEGTRVLTLGVSGTNIQREITFNITEGNGSVENGSGTSNDNTDSGNSGGENYKEVYRLYNNKSGEHLYTTDVNEKNVLRGQADWDYEGVSWKSPTKTGEAVYRLYSPVTGFHLYTTDKNEVKVLSTEKGWSIDNNQEPLYYSGGNTSIYRLYNEGLRQHLLTTDSNEYNTLPSHGWTQEGAKLKGH